MTDADTRHGTTWIIGATSGVGRASALRLANASRRLLLSGRRSDLLDEVAAEVRERGGVAVSLPFDVGSIEDWAEVDGRLPDGDDAVGELVFCAGRNVLHRAWSDLAMDEFSGVVETNLTAVARAMARVVPSMRERGFGRIVVIGSWAGWTYGRGAGVAYSASKTGLKALTETLNDQEGPNGLSACLLCPGDIDTPLVDHRPIVPNADERAKMLSPDDVARAVEFVLDMPAHASVNELVLSPIHSHSYGR